VKFRITDGKQVIPVVYKGIIPDTFTDAEDIQVVVEGRLGRDGVFHATTLLAKCASRYENAPGKGDYEKAYQQAPGYRNAPAAPAAGAGSP